jgi:hypothetical protein
MSNFDEAYPSQKDLGDMKRLKSKLIALGVWKEDAKRIGGQIVLTNSITRWRDRESRSFADISRKLKFISPNYVRLLYLRRKENNNG